MPDSDLLSQLKDIHTRDDIAWQLAWGWWLVIVLGVITLIILVVYLFKSRQKKRLKNQVKHALEEALEGDNPAIECSLILRSYADFYYPERNLKALNEKQWQDFLVDKLPMNKDLILLFSQSMYQAQPNIDKPMLLDYCQKWVDCV